ncbi:adenosine deaminase [Aliiroseovarius halocynthiae]|uniref:Adenosine deaminase n=1 Tax=Aliiroseovarius halocynthiae TaxID=985055 RepID=A0A545SR59_9RHOB|nr:adenosine deaminase [Aliiroseovarius halocynthiae]TQV67458.1 adenosine deaminase [Aliiroseovarius halocynthiae]SMR81466.1 adenosine deaminase [Aliiroseovarius halocynthiae]
MSFKEQSKVELHLHIEGGAPPDFIRTLAKEKSVDLSGIFTEDGGYAYRDFWHFLEVYEAATSVLTGPEEFRRLTKAVLEACAEKGVVYAETFLSPDFCGGRDVAAWKDYLAAIQDAATEAERDHGITLRGIATCIRHFGPEFARETALCAQETAGGFLTGFGMGGDEKSGSQGDFAYAYDMAREAGLRLTTHAGEWNGPDEIRAALDDLKVERIGHGVRAIEDLALVERLVEDGVTLEVCPGSNVFLGVYPDLSAHPIAKLRERGVNVTVSTDDPPFFRTDMVKEYQDLSRQFGWTPEDFRELNLVAIDAAFCDDATRNRIRKHLEKQDV